jgi:hypothetical protein
VPSCNLCHGPLVSLEDFDQGLCERCGSFRIVRLDHINGRVIGQTLMPNPMRWPMIDITSDMMKIDRFLADWLPLV